MVSSKTLHTLFQLKKSQPLLPKYQEGRYYEHEIKSSTGLASHKNEISVVKIMLICDNNKVRFLWL